MLIFLVLIFTHFYARSCGDNSRTKTGRDNCVPAIWKCSTLAVSFGPTSESQWGGDKAARGVLWHRHAQAATLPSGKSRRDGKLTRIAGQKTNSVWCFNTIRLQRHLFINIKEEVVVSVSPWATTELLTRLKKKWHFRLRDKVSLYY